MPAGSSYDSTQEGTEKLIEMFATLNAALATARAEARPVEVEALDDKEVRDIIEVYIKAVGSERSNWSLYEIADHVAIAQRAKAARKPAGTGTL